MLNCIQSRENSGGAAARQPTPKIGLCLDLQMGLAVNGKWEVQLTVVGKRVRT